MVKRADLGAEADPPAPTSVYFANPAPDVDFIHTGCTLLDCVIGGGYPTGRIVNIVGDKSTAKSLLAIEASANFNLDYPGCPIWYNETESAFDVGYAEALGMPIDRITFPDPCFTVEDVYEHLVKCIDECGTSQHGLYIIDSLDALSDRAELGRDIDEGTFGAAKAKKMSELFRRLVQKLEKSKITVLIISQVRDNIGVTFGRKTTRSGGRALDFYASQVIYLAHIKTLSRTKKKIARPTGIRIKAKCDKNKVGLPFRDCTFDVLFGYGIDDLASCLSWLETVHKLGDFTEEKAGAYLRSLDNVPQEEYQAVYDAVVATTREAWQDIEISFLPTRKKYT